MSGLLQLDFAILDWIAAYLHHGVLDIIMPLITRLGDDGIIWILLGLLLLCFSKERKQGLQVFAALLLSYLLCNVLLKNIVARTRPFDMREGIELLIRAPLDFSFPSGHASSSFAVATVLCLNRWKGAVPALVLAGLIAFSRLYLYVHYPSDVVVGVLLGCFAGYLAVKLCNLGEALWRKRRRS